MDTFERERFLHRINPGMQKLAFSIICTLIRLFFIVQGGFIIYYLVSFHNNYYFLFIIFNLLLIVADSFYILIVKEGKEHTWYRLDYIYNIY